MTDLALPADPDQLTREHFLAVCSAEVLLEELAKITTLLCAQDVEAAAKLASE